MQERMSGAHAPGGEKDTLQVTAGGNQVRLQDGDSQLPLSLSKTFARGGTHGIQLRLYCGDRGGGSVGTAKDNHVLREAG